MRLLQISIILSLIFTISISAQTECSSIDGETIDIDYLYSTGIHNFPKKYQRAFTRVTNYFNTDITFIYATGYDGVCHEYLGPNRGEITVGEFFLNKYGDNLLFIEFIIAHEIGHNLQHTYKNHYKNIFLEKYGKKVLKGKYFEMQADVIAGYYLGYWMDTKKSASEAQIDQYGKQMENVLKNMAKISDLKFTSDKHHGDFINRERAVLMGYYLYWNENPDFRIFNETIDINSFQQLYYYSFKLVEKKLIEKGITIE